MNQTYIIAEAGVNHNGSFDTACQLVDIASASGADAVKFQTFLADKLVTSSAEKAEYQKKNTGAEESQYEMLKKLELSFDDFERLQAYCRKKGIRFLSTPFDEESAVFLIDKLKMDKIKIPSGEVINLPFLRFLAKFGKPLILSTGMSDMGEIERAVETVFETSPALSLSLLHCTTNYPCPMDEVNLRAMITLKEHFGLPIGYSDHTMGIEVAIAAVSLGAQIIEKHFTLNRNLPGPDHRCSLEPHELNTLVASIRNIEQALGSSEKKPTKSELQIRQQARKSITVARDLSAGAILKDQDVIMKRPGDGISPAETDKIVGRKLRVNKKANETLVWEDLQ